MSGRKRKWYSLYGRLLERPRLRTAAEHVLRNNGAAGVDGQTCADFRADLEEELRQLQSELQARTYQPRPVRRVWIEKPNGGQRPLGIPAVRDRVVQQAVRAILEPIFEAKFHNCSFGFRPGRSAHQALDRITEHLEAGAEWVLDADIQSYFDTIPHNRLIDAVAEEVADGSILNLLRLWLEAGILEGGVVYANAEGTPQGGVISPLLANIYLHAFDDLMVHRGHRLVRYADDWVLLLHSRRAAERVLAGLQRFFTEELSLTLHPEKTRIVHISEGFPVGSAAQRPGPGPVQGPHSRHHASEPDDESRAAEHGPEPISRGLGPLLLPWPGRDSFP